MGLVLFTRSLLVARHAATLLDAAKKQRVNAVPIHSRQERRERNRESAGDPDIRLH